VRPARADGSCNNYRMTGFGELDTGKNKGVRMKKYLFAAVCGAAIATPAQARDGQFYAGIEGGILFAPDHDADIFVDYTTTQTPVAPLITAPAPVDTTFSNALNLDYKMGIDLDAVV